MGEFIPPAINEFRICIASKNARILAGLVSSYFNNADEYFAVFMFPEVSHSFSENNNFESDGFLSRMIGGEAAVLINNAIFKLRPKKIIFAGLNDKQKTFLSRYIPKDLIIDINSVAEVDVLLSDVNANFKGQLLCNPEEIAQGLIISKYEKLKIIFDQKAKNLPKKYINKNNGIVVIELNNDVDEIIAINYAFSVNADIKLVHPVNKTEVHILQESIYKWKREISHSEYKKIKKKILKRVQGINFRDYEFGTFFTYGLPYGLALNNIIPFSHVLNVRVDFFILDGILYEKNDPVGSAVVFSPKVFGYEETESVINSLEVNNFIVKQLIEKNATVSNLDNFGAHYPYDLLHICSHGGEIPGYYVIQKFVDRDGKEHTIEYDEVVGFSPETKEHVAVFTKAIFRKFDNNKWMSPELRSQNIPNYVFEDMLKALSQNKMSKDLIRVNGGYPISTSCHITCYDSIHQGQFRQLANYHSPLIFNNTCSSWYEIAVHFIAYGARSYIGTIWEIANSTAIKSAELFYGSIFVDNYIIKVVHDINQRITIEKYKNIYFFWGLHFSTLKKTGQRDDQLIFNDLVDSWRMWLRKYDETKTPEVKRNTLKILKFLHRTIHDDFTLDHVKKLKEVTEKAFEAYETSIDVEQNTEDCLSERSVMDIN